MSRIVPKYDEKRSKQAIFHLAPLWKIRMIVTELFFTKLMLSWQLFCKGLL